MSNGQYRVCVWGNDDTGMDYDSTQEDCAKMYEHLAGVEKVYKGMLVKFGFVPA